MRGFVVVMMPVLLLLMPLAMALDANEDVFLTADQYRRARINHALRRAGCPADVVPGEKITAAVDRLLDCLDEARG